MKPNPLALLLIVLATPAKASISVTMGALSYSQTFDSLTRSTTAETWVNDADTVSTNDAPRLVGLNGWYVGSFGTVTTTPQIRAGTGSSTTGSFFSYGVASAADRALGTLPSDTSASASMRIGARFVNNTGGIITGFTFTYDGEQWRKAQLATATNNQYVASYAVFESGTGALESSSYSGNLATATFNTPVDGGDNVGAALDGNDSTNRIAGLGATITDLTVAPGQEIWIRWFDSNSSGADQGIAIDNFNVTFTAVPEPAAAMIGGIGALVLLTGRRRRH